MYDSITINTSVEHYLYLKKLKNKKIKIKIFQIIIFITFFSLWEIAAKLKWIDPFIFSQPSRILNTAYTMILDKSIFIHIGVTLGETIAGFLLGTLLGTGVAVLLWWNSTIEKILDPYLVVLNSLPKTALAPILIVWLGNNIKSVIVTALMTSVIVTVLTVLSGFLDVDSDKIKLIKTFNGTKKQILTKVVLPASIPTIINALKVNVGLSFVGVMVGGAVNIGMKNNIIKILNIFQFHKYTPCLLNKEYIYIFQLMNHLQFQFIKFN